MAAIKMIALLKNDISRRESKFVTTKKKSNYAATALYKLYKYLICP